MAVAFEALTPEAQAAAARVSPEVRDYVAKKAADAAAKTASKARPPRVSQAPAAAKPAARPAARQARSSASTSSGGGGGVVRRAKAINSAGAKAISGGKGGMFPKIIFAFGAGLVALELASYVSGRYFTWNLKAGAQKLHAVSKVVDLYPGQSAKLAPILNPAPAAVTAAVPQYAGTRAV